MAVQRDNLHHSFRPIDGHNKPFNIVISAREPGKTTQMWMDKVYLPWKKNHKSWVYFVRQAVEIGEELITSIFSTNMNKFTDDNLVPIYKSSAFSDGIVDIYLDVKHLEKKTIQDEDGNDVVQEVEVATRYLFIRIISLSIKVYRIKKAILRNIAGCFFEEFIINPKFGEKYLTKEFEKFQEVYSTLRRESDGVLKCYFLGNPYSLFNPLFVGLKVPITKLKKDEYVPIPNTWKKYEFDGGIVIEDQEYKLIPHIYDGDSYAIQWAVLHPVLKKYILMVNPFYQFDEEYNSYAVEGCAVNDNNVKLSKLPQNFFLSFVLKMDGKYIGIFQNNYVDDLEDKYFCKFLDEVSARRTIYCFDFSEMVERSILMSLDERMKLQRFKNSLRKRLVSFEDINVYYYVEEVYKNI